MTKEVLQKIKNYRFLFEELVKRDFKKKYKRTALGMLWSVIGPLSMLLVMSLVFTQFFGRRMEHYIIYLFCGNLVFNYFKESTSTGMISLFNNSLIFSKVNVPKYIFLLSQNVSSLINFGINFVLLFVFMLVDSANFSWKLIMLIYPIGCLIVFNLGCGLILSALYMMFRDIKYLYDIFTLLLMYLSAIFYDISAYPQQMQYLFYLNPVYVYIRYFRKIVLEQTIPTIGLHILALGYALAVLVVGAVIYKKKNYKFLYYI
ncbi:MAG: ABC transporter permease [Ruminiclostridium sp.]|nr:ABC transporter permease [Ruminiclostridium sp.]